MADEVDFPHFSLSEQAAKGTEVMRAMAVPEEVRWRHIGIDNIALLNYLLAERDRLNREGIDPVQIELSLATIVAEVYRNQRDPNPETMQDEQVPLAGQPGELAYIAHMASETVVTIDGQDKKPRLTMRQRVFARLGAALLLSSARNKTATRDIEVI